MTLPAVRHLATSEMDRSSFWYSVTSQGGAMSTSLSFPSSSTSFSRSPRRFAATTTYSAAMSIKHAVHSRTTIATRATLARRPDLPPTSPLHSLPEKHSAGFPASTLSGSFAKKGVSGTRPENLLFEILSTTRFCRPARY
ncbi:hypothetical protein V8G54_013988 [Vigna mungo]|uniref:Uncharacterized protein n=1 Tax=Vigna mungo TaxID=3915 RepID=A0AAQ3NJV7_VIGMU